MGRASSPLPVPPVEERDGSAATNDQAATATTVAGSPSFHPLTARESIITSTEIEILRRVLDQWKSAVDAHDPDRAASYFTDDAIFQGLHPYGVGPAGIAEYYDSQPVGMTAAYDIRETRRLADDLVLGYLSVDFAFTDRPVLTVYLSVIVRRIGGTWLISHYQVSRLG